MSERSFPIYAKIDLPERPAGAKGPLFNRAQGRRFDVKAQAGVGEISIYDEIGFFGVSASDVRAALDGFRGVEQLKLYLNSPGGDVFDGIAIHNDLADFPAPVTVHVTGLAASAASLIAMAGDTIEMADNAFMMIHNAWTIAGGDRNWLREVADTLAGIDGALARTYASRSSTPLSDVQSMMDAETWLDGPSAVEKGFADKLTGKEEPKARFDLSVFAKAPEELKGQLPDRVFTTERDAERFLTRDAGLSRSNAQELIAACASPTAKRDAGRGDAFMRDAESAGDLLAVIERLNRTIQESI
jgi:ATP-dependent protease ClpP protease subunit